MLCLAPDFEIHICVNKSLYLIDPSIEKIASIYDAPIQRKISIVKDLHSLFMLILIFAKVRPFLIQSITPKAGLLSMLAGWLCLIPHRWHTFTGQFWENKSGIYKFLLKNADRLMSLFASKLAADSFSQARFLTLEKITFGKKITVLGHGSISGVDTKRFFPNPELRNKIRTSLKVNDDQIVFLFVGRLAREKGVFDLLAAFKKVLSSADQRAKPELWLVGPDDENILPNLNALILGETASIKIIGRTDRPEEYMAAADVICLPSYREGFGSIIIEGGACGVPAIGYKINGLVDSIADGKTGLLVEPNNIDAFAEAMTTLNRENKIRLRLGSNGYDRCLKEFTEDKVTALYKKSIVSLII